MSTNALTRFQGMDILEGKDGTMVLAKKVESKYNPYAVGKIRKRSKLEQVAGSASNRSKDGDIVCKKVLGSRTAPDEKTWKWSMGYNHLVGQYAPGNRYAEMTGSSINRSKNENESEKFPRSLQAAHFMAAKTEDKYIRAGEGLVLEWEGGRSEHVSTIVEGVRSGIERGDIEAAGGLAMRFRSSFRKRARGISFGVHVLSARSRGKIRDKATAFFRACAGARIFATFTFIAPLDDQAGIAILNKFLTQLRKKEGNLNYFWVAERQDNGNIHFHMILNKRLPICRWNAMWTLAQYNAGLTGKTEDGKNIVYDTFMEAYKQDDAAGWPRKRSATQALLNPVDVKKIETINKLASYLTKYITKQDKGMRFGCSPWHCSRRVSRMFTRQTVGPSAFAYMKSIKNYRMDRSTGELFQIPMEKRVGNGFAVVILALDKSAPLVYMKRVEMVNKWILEGCELDVPIIDDEIYKRVICKN